MAIREIRTEEDSILYKKSKPVKEVTDKIRDLIDDMVDTMYEAEGVGLAAVQVGFLKRIFVVDVGEGIYVFINPEIIETSGTQEGYEGCLSVPGKRGIVIRPEVVKVKYFDIEMKEQTLEATGLFARAILHENDHLDGMVYTSKVTGEVENIDYATGEESN